MARYLSLVCAVIASVMLAKVQGSCYTGNLMAEMTVSGRFRYYCEYNQKGQMLRLLPGSNLVLLDECMDCKCTLDGLMCCGFGHAAGVIGHPADCKILQDGCQPILVKANNESLGCVTGEPLNFTSMYENIPHPDNTYTTDRYMTTTQKPTTTVKSDVTTTTVSPQTTETETKLPRRDGQFTRSFFELLRSMIKADPRLLNTQSDTTPSSPTVGFRPQQSAQILQPVHYDNFWPHDLLLSWYLL